jgi:exosome complex component RRP42
MVINSTIVKELAVQRKRIDGRSLTTYRSPISVTVGISKSAEGSARVQIGETVVLVGVKLSIEKPYNDTPDEGGIMVNAELTPLSNPEYETGPPGIKAIELARVIDRGIRESQAIDLKQLCIEKGEKAWFVAIDIIPLNDAGNLFDAAGLGALAALKDAKFPEVDELGIIDYKKKTTKSLPVTKETLPVTVSKIAGQLFIDPLAVEEDVIDARLTVATTPDGTIVALQKGGDMPLSIDDISAITDLALEKAKYLREFLDKAVQ